MTKDFDSIDVVLHWGIEMDIDVSNETHVAYGKLLILTRGIYFKFRQKKKKKKKP
jgi:hypothetical protein